MTSRLVILFGMLLLTGCAPYQLAPGTPVARLNLVDAPLTRICVNHESRLLSAEPDGYARIPANAYVSFISRFSASGANVSYSCVTKYGFIPVEGQNYYQSFELDNEHCMSLVFREDPQSRTGLALEDSIRPQSDCPF